MWQKLITLIGIPLAEKLVGKLIAFLSKEFRNMKERAKARKSAEAKEEIKDAKKERNPDKLRDGLRKL